MSQGPFRTQVDPSDGERPVRSNLTLACPYITRAADDPHPPPQPSYRPVAAFALADGLRAPDADFEARLRMAHERGELKADTAAAVLIRHLAPIAIRARAGIPRAELREIARKAVNVICG